MRVLHEKTFKKVLTTHENPMFYITVKAL